MFNRFPNTSPTSTGQALGTRMNGASLQYLNWYGSQIGTYTLTGDMIQTVTVATYPPSPTMTASRTLSSTPTATATVSSSASASNSHGITPTSSPSNTASVSSSWTPTPSRTVSASQLSTNPVQMRIETQGSGQCLDFVEIFVFDVTNRNVGASAAGAVLSLTTTFGTNVAAYGGDLNADPWAAALLGTFVNAGCTAITDYYTARFPAAPGYPNGYPTAVSTVGCVVRAALTSTCFARLRAHCCLCVCPFTRVTFATTAWLQVVFVNRLDNGYNARIVSSNGQVQLYSPGGSLVGIQSMTSSATVSTYTFNNPVAQPTPNPSLPVQLDPVQRLLSVRYVRVNASVSQCL